MDPTVDSDRSLVARSPLGRKGTAAIIAVPSVVVTYLGSGKRLKHEAKMQTERLADEKRREGLPLAAKAYRLAGEVRLLSRLGHGGVIVWEFLQTAEAMDGEKQ